MEQPAAHRVALLSPHRGTAYKPFGLASRA
jgi:hypothetical protein